MNWQVMIDSLPQLAEGALLTVELIVLSGILGLALAIPIALGRVAQSWWLRAGPFAFIFFFRGTPLLVQIFLIYYGLSQFEFIREGFAWPILREAYWCAIIAFTLNTAAYTAEILRGAIQAVPVGEVEAAKAIGMSRWMRLRRIILPRAFRIALPAYSNEVILMLKGSALASTITLLDLTGMARTIIARTYMPIEIFIAAGVFYLIIAAVILQGFRFVEKRLHGVGS